MDALELFLLPERRPEAIRPRKSIPSLLAIGSSNDRQGDRIECYCPQLNKWTAFMETSKTLQRYQAVLIEDRLIVLGGWDLTRKEADCTGVTATVACLDLTSREWSKVTPMETSRDGLCAAVLEGMLYAIGGQNGKHFFKTVERWDPKSDTWSYVSSMSEERYGAGAAVLYDQLYVIGGGIFMKSHSSMECYSPRTNTWNVKAPMNRERKRVGVAVANGYIYALGGCVENQDNISYLKCVERYDPRTDTWTFVSIIRVFELLSV